MSPPTLAAVVWTLQNAVGLEKTLEPLVFGPCRPDEILVLAAALTDETAELLAAYGHRHPGLRPPIRDEGSRALESFDRAVPLGIEATSARWVMLLAAGDVVLPEALRRALDLANEHPSAGAVLARAATFDPAGALATECRGIPGRTSPGFETGERFRELSLGGETFPLDHVVPRAALLRRDALAALGGLRSALGPLALSLAVWSLAAVHGAACLPEPLVNDQGPPSDLEQALTEDPGLLLEPFQYLDGLEQLVPSGDARRLRDAIHELVRARARGALARACDLLGSAARILAEENAPLSDRALAHLLEVTVRVERRFLQGPK